MNMLRRVVAAVTCLGLLTVGGQLALEADAAVAADAPTEVRVVPADSSQEYVGDWLFIAGSTGFVHEYRSPDAPVLWTRYADGVSSVIPELETLSPLLMTPAGGDVVTMTAPVPGRTVAGEIAVIDLATMTWDKVPRPAAADGTYRGYFGDAMLVQTGPAVLGLRRFASDGTYSTTPVTGVPADTTSLASTRAGDEAAVVMSMMTGGEERYGLLDLAAATMRLLPKQPVSVRKVLLSADHVGFFGGPLGGMLVSVYSRTAISDEPEVVALPDITAARGVIQIALAGSHVIASTGASASTPVVDYSAGGATILPVGQDGYGVLHGTEGLLLVGGSGPADWAVHRMTADTKVAAVLPLGGPLTNAGLTISQGLLRHVQVLHLPGVKAAEYQLFNHGLVADSKGDVPHTAGGFLSDVLPCHAEIECLRTVDGSFYGTSYLRAGATAKSSVLETTEDGNRGYSQEFIPSAPGKIVDVSAGYVVVNGADPVKQYVVDVGQSEVRTVGPAGAAALWFDTLWTSPKPGYVSAKNLRTGKTAPPVQISASCTPTELQATGVYVYWSCGASGPAGVFDHVSDRSYGLQAGQHLLGAGYLVKHEVKSGRLVRYDLVNGTTAATVATLPRGPLDDERGITWAVDKFGGNIAYVDAANAVHIVDPGIARSAPADGSFTLENYLKIGQDENAWVQYQLTRPVAAWTVTITKLSTGNLVSTRTGGPSRRSFYATWDGYLANKKKVPSGRYRFTTAVSAATGAKPVTIDSGIFVVAGGTPNFRSYDSNGLSSVLGIASNGEGSWLVATYGTALRNNGFTEPWVWGSGSGLVNAIVPFGDFNNDGNNDLIARSGTGTLRAYLGRGENRFDEVKMVTIGKGWNRYNALLTSGDLTGDGNADLVARDAKGKLWRYDGTGRKSFKTRVRLSGNFKAYARVLGPGDISGDGRADLVVVSKSGTMSAAYGTGKGKFGKLRKVSSGWSKYNAVISAGDLNEDGRNDLLARDKAGVMWRYLGNGKGVFGARQKIGAGYKKYSRIF